MPLYRVRWEIDIEADNANEAAARALIVQRDNDPDNSATVFGVCRRDLAPPGDVPTGDVPTGWVTVDLDPEAAGARLTTL